MFLFAQTFISCNCKDVCLYMVFIVTVTPAMGGRFKFSAFLINSRAFFHALWKLVRFDILEIF